MYTAYERLSGEAVESNPMVSALTVTSDGRFDYTWENICSVADQRVIGPNLFRREHIVVGNGLTDDTFQRLQGNLQGSRFEHVKLVESERELSIGGAYNLAFANSVGSIAVVVDSDDNIPPHGLQVQVNEMMDNPGVGFGFGMALLVDADGREVTDTKVDYDDYVWAHPSRLRESRGRWSMDRADFFKMLWECNQITCGTVALRREAIEAVGGWLDHPECISPDWAMYQAQIAQGTPFGFYTSYVSRYRLWSGQLSAMPDVADRWEQDRVIIREWLRGKFSNIDSLLEVTAKECI